ncbi:YihY/virulence factor BrkB family protein [Arcticibacterium luteifluviistationis]|uniref:YihY/virulence factor BrkB family protein n=1 Tax=Arcticibacterium luteifluviistationis TaxID=1784714 RepID=A0A2Z4G8K7_9BACT|nr:YihY/virulence factor BrkB family protein [Arcticibacterium luteifluviistationis]AWV97559.1 YihY/virulence factor BrkB family protein [Arcticibacterium luteifluviistationis]
MNSLKDIVLVKKLRKFLKSIYLWNTTVSLYLVLTILWRKIITFDIDQRAAAVSFSLLLAIFPAVIFLFTLIPYIPIANLDVQIMDFLANILPRGIYSTAANTIQDIISRRRVDVLSFGFLFALYAATNGMMALIRAFNISLEKDDKRGFFQGRLVALFLTFLLVLVMISAIVVLIVGKFSIAYLFEIGFLNEDFTYYMIQLLRYVSIFIIFFLGIGSIYYFAPGKNKRMSFFNIGAMLASILCILATNGFSYYLVNFNSYNKLYGSIGTLIGMMVWIYLIAVILIFGFEINSSLKDALAEEGLEE